MDNEKELKQINTEQIMISMMYYDDALFVDWVTSQHDNG